ncbi:MAG: NAD-dependent epimerase/dehydratase family protein [Oscillatoriales cyanobacterium]|nr:MAG: NAD-dependent epimerase/dehydratase family protein [Oscillatoriales cyanobacterium]TAH21110.1 MAG: NAD-dependent epimerase/dehydratase family protein [Oscillatoriales cyanobacterium]
MSPRKIAVLGSNSFSGSDFVDLLLEDGQNEILGISRSPEKGPLFLPYLRHKNPNFKFHKLDFNGDMPQILQALDEFAPEYIVNFAAQSEVAPSWVHPDHWFQTNTVALAQLINHLKDQKYLHRYVHISSPEVYGTCEGNVTELSPMNPSTPYAASKAAADMLLSTYYKNFQFPLVTVRATNVYGAYQQLFKIIPRSAIYLKLGKTIQLHGGGHAVKSYIHIRDVSRGELAVMEKGKVGEIYHLSPDRGYAVREVVQTICDTMNRSFAESTETVAERLGQDAAYVIDSTKARTELGWKSEISLNDGVAGVIKWVEEFWDEIEQQSLEYVHKP